MRLDENYVTMTMDEYNERFRVLSDEPEEPPYKFHLADAYEIHEQRRRNMVTINNRP